MGQRMKLYRVFVRNTADKFFDAWETEAPSIRALLDRDDIEARLAGQPIDELIITEIR
jgi:hypothetical protein